MGKNLFLNDTFFLRIEALFEFICVINPQQFTLSSDNKYKILGAFNDHQV